MIINGSLLIKNTLQAEQILLGEEFDLTVLRRGLTINPLDGYLYYKVDENTLFVFPSESKIDEKILEAINQIPSGGENSQPSPPATASTAPSKSAT